MEICQMSDRFICCSHRQSAPAQRATLTCCPFWRRNIFVFIAPLRPANKTHRLFIDETNFQRHGQNLTRCYYQKIFFFFVLKIILKKFSLDKEKHYLRLRRSSLISVNMLLSSSIDFCISLFLKIRISSKRIYVNHLELVRYIGKSKHYIDRFTHFRR